MPLCCEQPREIQSTPGTLTVALAGNPNSGKTTVFNALTGLKQKVANYPGVTVEKKTGRSKLPDGRTADIIDLPGTYSLISRSPDELVAMEVLRGLRPGTLPPDVVVVVVDASNLQRNLYLVSQLIELGKPMVLALNMMDVAVRRGTHVSPEALERELGMPVVPLVGHKRQGIEDLKKAIAAARVPPLPEWPLPQAMREELVLVGGGLAILGSEPLSQHVDAAGRPDALARPTHASPLEKYQALAERLLIGDRAADLVNVAAEEPVASLLASATGRMMQLGIDPMQVEIEAHYRWIEQVAERAIMGLDELAAMGNPAPPLLPGRSWTERIDSIFIHKIWGLVVFAAIMGLLFVAIFWAAAPVMDGLRAVVDWLGHAITVRMPAGPIKDLINDGIFAGVGAVLVFVPQIALLFLFLGILEDSGYLARAAFLMDRILSKVGLHGKSFIPLLSSFACAIPGVLATRTIEDRKGRLATILIIPFMSCSARLPVYALLIGTFFAARGALVQAGVMLGLYALGVAAAAGTAWLFRRTLLRGPMSAFILEMPSYKMPQPWQVARQVWMNTREFITKAGTIIFCLSVIVWAMAYYPRLPSAQLQALPDARARAAVQLRHSIAGRLGHVIEPVMRPLGYDWKMSVGLVSSFAAREVFVSTMSIVYSVGDPGEAPGNLSAAMRRDISPSGHPVWTNAVALSLLIWFVLAMQCMSTLAIVRRETGGWKWPAFMLLYMNALAYLVCLVVYQAAVRL